MAKPKANFQISGWRWTLMISQQNAIAWEFSPVENTLRTFRISLSNSRRLRRASSQSKSFKAHYLQVDSSNKKRKVNNSNKYLALDVVRARMRNLEKPALIPKKQYLRRPELKKELLRRSLLYQRIYSRHRAAQPKRVN